MVNILRYQLIVLLWTATLLEISYSDVYTSSTYIINMVLNEKYILKYLQESVTYLRNKTALSLFSKFYQHRLPRVKELDNSLQLYDHFKHPNALYLTIKQFAQEYRKLRSLLGSNLSMDINMLLSMIANERDVLGARLAFLRLQKVYNLSVSEMVRGNYLGYLGSQLNDVDAMDIGETAFIENNIDLAIQWLQEALTMARKREPSVGIRRFEDPTSIIGRILAILGRAYIRQDLQDEATEMYTQAQYLMPTDDNVIALKHELISKPQFTNETTQEYELDYQRLCQVQTKQTLNKFDPRLNCVYRQVILPYYRFKQELISVSPYVTLFYDVITDAEINKTIAISIPKLNRGEVQGATAAIKAENRTTHIGFVYDEESPTITRLSKRVGAITNLVTKESLTGGTYNAEPFQIANYGIGGYHSLHYDYFDQESLTGDTGLFLDSLSQIGGNRIATFLIYLSDVTRGGSTVFTIADIAVHPVRKMALFWYNFKPSGTMDEATLHSGCPVVIGHKWVSNKWMWIHGNTFTRRCGLTENATQLDIEPDMRRGWV